MTSATKDHAEDYLADLQQALAELDLTMVRRVREALAAARDAGKQVFVCGNGGSSAGSDTYIVLGLRQNCRY